ncbi:hypothetical protein [Streptomyces sp. NPDC002187]|uniref:hypothetical protein n=1 Tax=Streptomyces sp. NPDC002187 TaxID=3364637 RepID=UPI003688E2A3
MTHVADAEEGTSTSASIPGPRVEPPANWDSKRSRFPVYRATEESPRAPIWCSPEKCGYPQGSDAYRVHELYWSKLAMTWDEACAVVSGEQPMGRRRGGTALDVAHRPHLDDEFVVDCDVKSYASETGFVLRADGSATLAPVVVKRGVDDLRREVEAAGHSMDELTSYAESTKSDGRHLVFRQNPECRIERTMHHREDWRVDVLVNNWRACAPTPGYAVVRDIPVIMAPAWFAQLLKDVQGRLGPVGGRKAVLVRERFNEVNRAAFTGVRGGLRTVKEPALMGRWREAVLTIVRVADQYGEWNNRIHWAACRYAEAGWALTDAERDILTAARPWDERERRSAIATIRSGYRNGGAR